MAASSSRSALTPSKGEQLVADLTSDEQLRYNSCWLKILEMPSFQNIRSTELREVKATDRYKRFFLLLNDLNGYLKHLHSITSPILYAKLEKALITNIQELFGKDQYKILRALAIELKGTTEGSTILNGMFGKIPELIDVYDKLFTSEEKKPTESKAPIAAPATGHGEVDKIFLKLKESDPSITDTKDELKTLLKDFSTHDTHKILTLVTQLSEQKCLDKTIWNALKVQIQNSDAKYSMDPGRYTIIDLQLIYNAVLTIPKIIETNLHIIDQSGNRYPLPPVELVHLESIKAINNLSSTQILQLADFIHTNTDHLQLLGKIQILSKEALEVKKTGVVSAVSKFKPAAGTASSSGSSSSAHGAPGGPAKKK